MILNHNGLTRAAILLYILRYVFLGIGVLAGIVVGTWWLLQ